MKKYVCTVCGYIAEGEIPAQCPVCEKRLRVHIRGALFVSIVADKIRNDDRGEHRNDTHNDDQFHKREALFVPHSLKVLYHTIFRLS